jgi:predicted SAM-dependent methyltransferase
MISYSDVIAHRAKICSDFPSLNRKNRFWQNYFVEGKILNFGCGNVKAASHQEIKNVFRNVKSCDSDTTTGTDYNDIRLIDEKFDLIIGEHVLEHIKVEDIINGLAQKFNNLLNENGKLILTIPNLHNFGAYFTDFDHKNSAPPIDLAAIICCANFDLIDMFKWSKDKHMISQLNMTDFEKTIEKFMEMNYGLETDRYITMVFNKNGQV